MYKRQRQLDGILKVSICTREDLDKNILVPKWDIFINYEGESYITRERQEDGTYKWRTAMIGNLEESWYYGKYDTYMYFCLLYTSGIDFGKGCEEFVISCTGGEGFKIRMELSKRIIYANYGTDNTLESEPEVIEKTTE